MNFFPSIVRSCIAKLGKLSTTLKKCLLAYVFYTLDEFLNFKMGQIYKDPLMKEIKIEKKETCTFHVH